jgi:hypothetical protein
MSPIVLLVFLIFLLLWTQETLGQEKPKPKTPEEKLAEAIADYLKSTKSSSTPEQSDASGKPQELESLRK